jgi:alpha-ketoglutarate-dependent taurine dioxygenase
LLLPAEGASVLATVIAGDKLAPLADALIATRHLDVTDEGAIAALADELGGIDVLFNCAGFVHHGTILDSPYEEGSPRLAILHAREVPSLKGGTMFADMRAAYDALNDAMKQPFRTCPEITESAPRSWMSAR